MKNWIPSDSISWTAWWNIQNSDSIIYSLETELHDLGATAISFADGCGEREAARDRFRFAFYVDSCFQGVMQTTIGNTVTSKTDTSISFSSDGSSSPWVLIYVSL